MSRKARALPSSTSDDTSVPRSRTAPDAAARWRALFGCEPPHATGFIEQAVAWREQVNAGSDVAPGIARDLAVAARQAREGRAATTVCPTALIAAPRSIREPEAAPSAAPRSVSPKQPSAAPRTRSRPAPAPLPPASSQLLPGTRLVKAHGGRNHIVEVTAAGFLYEGASFTSLSAVAKHITGTHWNGLLFFGLRRRKTYPPRAGAHG